MSDLVQTCFCQFLVRQGMAIASGQNVCLRMIDISATVVLVYICVGGRQSGFRALCTLFLMARPPDNIICLGTIGSQPPANSSSGCLRPFAEALGHNAGKCRTSGADINFDRAVFRPAAGAFRLSEVVARSA